ncbi:MAG: HAD family hydrolase [Eubacteriales bacterium]|nr:HAD family hydrolase [Eubacteriales bacterium]
MIKLIASDLDGTLLNRAKEIPEFTRRVLGEATARGIHFVPATGRAFAAVPEEVRQFPGVEYVITSNGATIYSVSQGRRIYQCLMDGEAAEALIKIPRSEGVVLEAFVEGEPYSETRYVENPQKYGATEYGARYVKKTRHPVPDMEAFIRQNRNRLDSIAFVCNEENERERLRGSFQQQKDIYVTSSVSHLLEIGHKDAGKGNTLLWLLRFLGISPSEAAAFGDADNDIEMLSGVKYGFAMANGTESCKEAAFGVTGSNEEDGVGTAVIRLLRGE